MNTVTSTLVENRTYLQTTTFLSTATATTTEIQKVQETGLSECLGKVCLINSVIGTVLLTTYDSANPSGRCPLEIATLKTLTHLLPLLPLSTVLPQRLVVHMAPQVARMVPAVLPAHTDLAAPPAHMAPAAIKPV